MPCSQLFAEECFHNSGWRFLCFSSINVDSVCPYIRRPVLLGPLFLSTSTADRMIFSAFPLGARADETWSYKIQRAVRPGFMSSSSELFQKGNLIPVIFLPSLVSLLHREPTVCIWLCCLAWPPCRVQTVLELVLLPGAATCRYCEQALPPASSLLGVFATDLAS